MPEQKVRVVGWCIVENWGRFRPLVWTVRRTRKEAWAAWDAVWDASAVRRMRRHHRPRRCIVEACR